MGLRALVLFLRSGGTYESLRSSGCLHLPSQQTLRDYTHYVEAEAGFSSDVDKMLMTVANIESCPIREKYVFLLLDEMHIKEDLVFDKHSGMMIGFTDLGDINMHLLQFEESMKKDNPPKPQIIKSMMAFMVRDLFTRLQFPYAQFPCANLSGEQLYEPFWEAVRRVETCGFKVMCDLLLKFNHNKMYVGSWSNTGWQFCESKVDKAPWSYTRFGL